MSCFSSQQTVLVLDGSHEKALIVLEIHPWSDPSQYVKTVQMIWKEDPFLSLFRPLKKKENLFSIKQHYRCSSFSILGLLLAFQSCSWPLLMLLVFISKRIPGEESVCIGDQRLEFHLFVLHVTWFCCLQRFARVLHQDPPWQDVAGERGLEFPAQCSETNYQNNCHQVKYCSVKTTAKKKIGCCKSA